MLQLTCITLVRVSGISRIYRPCIYIEAIFCMCQYKTNYFFHADERVICVCCEFFCCVVFVCINMYLQDFALKFSICFKLTVQVLVLDLCLLGQSWLH